MYIYMIVGGSLMIVGGYLHVYRCTKFLIDLMYMSIAVFLS